MTFDPDKALKEARESVHGFYFDGPSEAESTVENLRALLMFMFEQERKLKLERLMYKADARAWSHQQQGNYARVERWESLYYACADKLEELKK